jgi:AcrR family transcriptional regulator
MRRNEAILMRTEQTLQHRKQDFVRGAIWDVAVDLFVAKGFDRTTVDDIARAAGVSKRSFFRYFASKSDLMGQGMVTYGTYITEAVRTCPPTRSQLDLVRHTVQQVAVGAAAHPRVRKVAHVASTSVAARAAQLSRLAELEDRVAEAYRVRCQARSSDDLNPRLLAELTLSVLDVTFRQWFKRDEDEIVSTIDHVFAALLDLVCSHKRQRDKRSSVRSIGKQARSRPELGRRRKST